MIEQFQHQDWTEIPHETFVITQFRTRVFVFQFFSVQGGNSTDVKIHSSEIKMYSADVKIQVKIRNHQIAI